MIFSATICIVNHIHLERYISSRLFVEMVDPARSVIGLLICIFCLALHHRGLPLLRLYDAYQLPPVSETGGGNAIQLQDQPSLPSSIAVSARYTSFNLG